MGVAGSGKTTVGKAVAGQLGLPFYEGDDFHPQANIAKMSAGIPLTDEDRAPWIDALVAAINERKQGDTVVACSALSRSVRQRIRDGLEGPTEFILLTARPDVIEERLRNRPQHYMKAGMLASQFAALQMPQQAHCVDIERPLDEVVAAVVKIVRGKASHPAPPGSV
jgi:gluconokinase